MDEDVAYEVVKEPCTTGSDERAPVTFEGEPVRHAAYARSGQLRSIPASVGLRTLNCRLAEPIRNHLSLLVQANGAGESTHSLGESMRIRK